MDYRGYSAFLLLLSMLIYRPDNWRLLKMSREQREQLALKKRFIRRMWGCALVMMLANPAIAVVLSLGLFTTFVSFALIDEGR